MTVSARFLSPSVATVDVIGDTSILQREQTNVPSRLTRTCRDVHNGIICQIRYPIGMSLSHARASGPEFERSVKTDGRNSNTVVRCDVAAHDLAFMSCQDLDQGIVSTGPDFGFVVVGRGHNESAGALLPTNLGNEGHVCWNAVHAIFLSEIPDATGVIFAARHQTVTVRRKLHSQDFLDVTLQR